MRVPTPGKKSEAVSGKTPAKSSETTETAETEQVGFPCGHCGTRMHALLGQVGHKLECPDCGVMAEVPAPLPPKPKSVYARELSDIEAYEVEEVGTVAPSGPPVEETSFSVLCDICDSLLAATLEQVGTDLECVDCGHLQKVRKPRVKQKPMRPSAMDEEERDPYELHAPIETPDASKYVDIGDHKEYVERAREKGILRGEYRRPTAPAHPFTRGVFSFPFSLGVWPHWVMLSFFALTSGFLFNMAATAIQSDSMTAKAIAVIMALLGFVALLLYLFSLSPYLLAVFKSSAAGSDEIDWPDLVFVDWMFDLFFMVYSLSLSAIPAGLFFLGLRWVGIEVPFSGLLVFFSAFLLHPLAFLTITGSESAIVPWAPDVWRGMLLASGKVITFYISLFLFDVAIVLLLVIFPLISFGLSFYVLPCLSVAIAMVYFRLVGRLALCCSDVVYKAALAEEAATKKKNGPELDSIDQAHQAAMR